jgi:hypothetical protein
MHRVAIITTYYDHAGEDSVPDTTSWGMLDWVAKAADVNTSGIRAYRERENAYVKFLQDICHEFGGEHLVVANPILLKPPASYLGEFRNGSLISLTVAGQIVRSMLRGGASFGCDFLVPGSDLRIAVGPGSSMRIEAEDQLISLVASKLPSSFAVTGQVELDDEYISVSVDEAFWDAVMRDGADHGRPVWVQERWAEGRYGERFFLANSATIQTVRDTVYSNSAICAGAVDIPVEVITLDEVFDEVNVDSADEFGLLITPKPIGVEPELGALPLDSRLLRSGEISLGDPVSLIYPGKFRVEGRLEPGERLWEGVVPDPEGRLRARWLGLTIPGRDAADR